MIGIIGGVGPTAGADLLQKITEETGAAKDQEHLPVILFSLPQQINDRTEYLEGKVENNPGNAIAKIALQLHNLGVTVAGVPCNTAHAYPIFSVVKNQLSEAGAALKLVNMIDENINYLQSTFKKATRIGVLSTTGTYKQKLYSSRLREAGYTAIVPTEELQRDLVHTSIYHREYGIKTNNGKSTTLARTQLETVLNLMKQRGAEAVILGCTELPLALPEPFYNDMLLIDATRILARAMIREYDSTKLKEETIKNS